MSAIQLLPGRQRAALILRDVLGWTGPEVADLLQTTVMAVNSALQRARATVDATMPQRAYLQLDPEEQTLLDRYVAVWRAGDFDGLVELLRDDTEIRMPPLPSVTGARAVTEFLLSTAAHGDLASMEFTLTRANGRPAVLVHHREADGHLTPHGVKIIDIADGRITGYDPFPSTPVTSRCSNRNTDPHLWPEPATPPTGERHEHDGQNSSDHRGHWTARQRGGTRVGWRRRAGNRDWARHSPPREPRRPSRFIHRGLSATPPTQGCRARSSTGTNRTSLCLSPARQHCRHPHQTRVKRETFARPGTWTWLERFTGSARRYSLRSPLAQPLSRSRARCRSPERR